jgi:hypothetical protein
MKSSAALLWDEGAGEASTEERSDLRAVVAKRRAFRVSRLCRPLSAPELYRLLDLRRRRAQIRARRALGLE